MAINLLETTDLARTRQPWKQAALHVEGVYRFTAAEAVRADRHEKGLFVHHEDIRGM